MTLVVPTLQSIVCHQAAIKQEEPTSCCDDAIEHHAHEYDASLTPDAYALEVQAWARAGATVVGGCCGVFPEHIQRLREVLADLPGSAAQAPPM